MLSSINNFSFNKKGRNFQELSGTYTSPSISLSSVTSSSVILTISNYDSSITYRATSSAGFPIISGSTIRIARLNGNQSTNVTLTAIGSNGLSFSTTGTFLSLPSRPSLSFSSRTSNSLTILINNYDASLTYNITSSGGTVSRSGNTITISGLSEAQQFTISVYASNSSGNSPTGSISSFTSPATPLITFSSGGANSFSAPFVISNYNSSYSYSITSSVGTIVRNGNTITIKGLNANQSVNITVTATANSINSSTGSSSGSSSSNPVATGGTITTPGDGYRYHTFTSSGTITFTTGGVVEFAVISGGGTGGSDSSGLGLAGGGGGGGISASGAIIAAGSYSIVVGGAAGNSSAFNLISSSAGGSGGSNAAGSPGGSGGGGGWYPGGSGINGQGYPGGSNNGYRAGGGGGGGARVGSNSSGSFRPARGFGGPGGSGLFVWGSFYSGGGGGGGQNGGGSGGTGGGGPSGVAGTVNTGGGGGGATGGSLGGSGIVIVRYAV